MSFDTNPMDDMPIDQDEYEAWESQRDRCTCAESARDVLSVIYDPNGNAMTHGEIVMRLNEVPELQYEASVLSDRYTNMEKRANELREALEKIEKMQGCECDQYHGHSCLMCKVRHIARNAVAPF